MYEFTYIPCINNACPLRRQVDLLDRLLIIRTTPYALEEMAQIIALRAKVGGCEYACVCVCV